MENFFAAVAEFIRNFDWNSPEAFWAAILMATILMQRWGIFFMVILVLVIGANIEKVLVLDFTFNNFTVTAPFMVYLIGAVIVFVKGFLSLFER